MKLCYWFFATYEFTKQSHKYNMKHKQKSTLYQLNSFKIYNWGYTKMGMHWIFCKRARVEYVSNTQKIWER